MKMSDPWDTRGVVEKQQYETRHYVRIILQVHGVIGADWWATPKQARVFAERILRTAQKVEARAERKK